MNSVCVISKNGERLMPTFRLGKVRHLLKDGKAKIINHHPFTIQLLYDSTEYVQPIEACEDVGYNYIGISVKSESHEYVSAQYDTLKDEKRKHDSRRMYRSHRRNRLRYRKSRFNNRKINEGWLAPSIEHKKNLNVEIVKRYARFIPITKFFVEVGQFDTQRLKAIEEGTEVPEGKDYQHGPRYNYDTLREAVFYRDNYTCKICGHSAMDGAILHTHHALFWKGRHGNSLSELLTVCEQCHTPANHQPTGKLWGLNPKLANLEGAAFMNTVRWYIVEEFYNLFGEDNVKITYGCYTKESRNRLGLDKSHANDAYVMGNYHPTHRCDFTHYQKKRRNNRILDKFYDAVYIDSRTGKISTGKELFNGKTNRDHTRDTENLHKYRSRKISKGRIQHKRKTVKLNVGDIVSLDGEYLVVAWTTTNKNGKVQVQFVNKTKNGKGSCAYDKLKIIKTRFNNGWKVIKS